MFSRKYKKGMADASKAYQAFGQKQEEALNHILEEVRQGRKSMEDAMAELNGNLDGLYDHLRSKEKASLYTVYTPFDIKELGNEEQLFLLGALLVLTTDKSPNENQQNYIRAVQRYLDIKDLPFGVKLTAIENIESLSAQKAILQTVLEYLRLQDGEGYDETELQQEFLDAFSVSNKVKNEIIEHVELLYSATGAQGLAEKYGYVPEEEPEAEESTAVVDTKTRTVENTSRVDDIPEDICDKIYQQLKVHDVYQETDGYFAYSYGQEGIYTVDKRTGETQHCMTEEAIRGAVGSKPGSFSAIGDRLSVGNKLYGDFYSENYNVSHWYLLNIPKREVEFLCSCGGYDDCHPLSEDYSLFSHKTDMDIKLFDHKLKKMTIIADCRWWVMEAIIVENDIFMMVEDHNNYNGGYMIQRYSISNGEFIFIARFNDRISHLAHYDGQLFFLLTKTNSIYSTEKYDICSINAHSNENVYNIHVNNTIIYKDSIKPCDNGWLFVIERDDHPICLFDFDSYKFSILAKGCNPNGIRPLHKIGNYLYYVRDRRTVKISITHPNMVQYL